MQIIGIIYTKILSFDVICNYTTNEQFVVYLIENLVWAVALRWGIENVNVEIKDRLTKHFGGSYNISL